MSLAARLHDRLSESVFRPSYEGLRFLSPRHRADQLAFTAGMSFRSRTRSWSEDRKRDWMLRRLRETLRYAYNTTAFYREEWDALGFDPRMDFSFEDFNRLPVLSRKTVQDHVARLRSSAIDSHAAHAVQTGGSTGEPIRVFTGPEERGWREAGSVSFFNHIGASPGSRRAFLWGHHLDPVASDGAADRFKDFVSNRRWFDCLRLSEANLAEYHREMTRFQPLCVVAYASALASLADFLERAGLIPNYPTCCFVTGAEKLHGTQRDVIERIFGRPVFERYGSRDVGDMAYQISAAPTLTVDWALTLVEPASTDLEAPILVTKLHGDAMPLVRYDTGDAARFASDASPGNPAFSLLEVVGRSVDRIMLPDGRWVHGCHFPHLLKDFRIRDYQVHQSADYSVRVRLNPAADCSDEDIAGIRQNLEANLPGLQLSITTGDDIPKSKAAKWRPVTSELGHGKA